MSSLASPRSEPWCMDVEEDQRPMLEMAARTAPSTNGGGGGASPPPPPDCGGVVGQSEECLEEEEEDDQLSMLALEYAVGTGVACDWDTEEPEAPCGDDCGENDGPFLRFGRTMLRLLCKKIGAKRLGYMSVLKYVELPHHVAPRVREQG